MKKISLLLVLCMLLLGIAPMRASAAGQGPKVSVNVDLDSDGNIVVSWNNQANVDKYAIDIYLGSDKVDAASIPSNTTQCTFKPVDYNTDYTISVSVYYKDGSSSISVADYVYILPAPSDLTATADNNGTVTLTWKNHTKYITGFEISEDGSNGDGGVTKPVYNGQSSFTFDKARTAGVTYTYTIRAVNSYGASDYSNKATLTLPNASSDAPSACTAQLQSDGSVKVTWKDNSSWETGFTVTRLDSNGTYRYFDTVANATSYIDAGPLSTGITYTYSVCAHDDNGQSGSSNTSSVTINAKTPTAPSGLTAKQNQDKIILTWIDNSDNETGFVLKRTDNQGFASTSTTLAAGATTYTDAQAITAKTTYTYELTAVNASGSSSAAKVSITATSSSGTVPDFDGTQSSWAEEELTQAYQNGLTYSGVMSNFGSNITREEFCSIVLKMYEKLTGTKAKSSDNPFTDTNNEDIVKAYRLGIVKGTGATTFSPQNLITRQEICVMITRCLKISVSGIQISANGMMTFADTNQISGWAQESMNFCYSAGIMKGVGGNKIAPLSNTTREQAIVLLERTFLEYNK